jgi:hypothetical protein
MPVLRPVNRTTCSGKPRKSFASIIESTFQGATEGDRDSFTPDGAGRRAETFKAARPFPVSRCRDRSTSGRGLDRVGFESPVHSALDMAPNPGISEVSGFDHSTRCLRQRHDVHSSIVLASEPTRE